MELFFQLILLCVGLIFLWKIGEFAVQNAIGFSVIYGIERFTVGFFIFAISTGLPEMSAAIVSSIKKVPELSAGDLMGSTFVNVSLILGISILLAKKIEIPPDMRKKLFGTIGLIVLIFFGTVLAQVENILTGILLIIIYIGSAIWFQTSIPKKEVSKELHEIEAEAKEKEKKPLISPKIDICIKLFASLLLLILSSWLTVYSATNVAEILQLNLSIIGATFIAIGTSLPELTLEIHAVKQKEYSLAIGDIFGSSLLNISFILGLLILMNPSVDLALGKLIFPFLFAAILWVVFRLLQKKPFLRKDGLVFIGIFLVYISTMTIYSIFIAK
ncbi:MAG: Inner membrane protein YrbG [Chlamydiae bacterium]|nr:Inner membrane protein YrbG [Chlamydiota bacterium]